MNEQSEASYPDLNYEKVKSKYSKVEKKNFFTQYWVWLTIIGLLLLINFFQFFYRNNFDTIIKIIFLDSKGKFEWAGITAVAALGTFLSTLVLTYKKNRSDLISKARIKWLETVKSLTSSYLTDAAKLPTLYKKIDVIDSKKREEAKKDFNDCLRNFSETRNLLLLNYSDNEDNKQIINCINDCSEFINKWTRIFSDEMQKKEEDRKIPTSKTNTINNLRIVSRDYFKREWDEVKKGK